jgi:hypothetical protein
MSIEAIKQALVVLELEDMACRHKKELTPEHISKAIIALHTVISDADNQDTSNLKEKNT